MARGEVIKISDDTIKHIQSMAGMGLTMEKISIILGMHKRSLEKKAKRNKKLRAAILKGRAMAEHKTVSTAYKIAWTGNVSMLIFLLKTRYGYKEQDTITIEGLEKIVKEEENE